MRERRSQRSRQIVEAMSLLLSARAKRRGSEAVVVGTEDGLVVAAAKSCEAELVAAFGASKVRGQRVTGAEKLTARKLMVDGLSLVLTAVGGPPVAAGELDADILRILRAA